MKKTPAQKTGTKGRALITLCLILIVTLAAGYLGFNGMPLDSRGLYKLLPWLPTADVAAWPKALPLGLDLQGGVYVEYQAKAPADSESDDDALIASTISVIQSRLTQKGYPESTVVRLGNDGIRVEIPAVSDPNEILTLIGSPAKLEFRTPEGETFMEGKHVESAYAGMSAEVGTYVVQFTLTKEGAAIFADYTGRYVGQALSIYLDGALVSSPTVQSVIPGGQGFIEVGDKLGAETLAAQIQSGALPMEITQQKVDTVSASLGVDALSTSITAAAIGILIVMLIMILRYRLNGIVASWALCLYMILLFFFIAVIPGIQLTLPGIAGIVLGIGMAVDANVVIFERINEEIRVGRPLKACVRTGFKHAMSAVLDANVTTFIAGVVLLSFGTGSVQGFAKTLLLSVVTSLITAVLLTRLLLTSLVNLGCAKPGLYTSVKHIAKEAQ
ncbi:MAG: protein translocase subunit SecD [Clostridia bacterium]|nr:protein translocase subunit SecD [Clostridia bacterium]